MYRIHAANPEFFLSLKSTMKHIFSLITILICCVTTHTTFCQELETETARLPKQGFAKIGTAFEYQTSQVGKEYAVPLVLEYGITDRLEFVLEPVLFTNIRSVGTPSATGIGDLEVTLTYLLTSESSAFPSIAIAAEIKAPTAKNTLIGTGKTDYAVYLVGSKKIGDFDVHANVNYTIRGNPVGASLMNTWFFAGAFDYNLSERYLLFGEIYGNTASIIGSESETALPISSQTKQPAEASAGEIVGSFGAGYYLSPGLLGSLSLSYDNNNAALLRAAFSYTFALTP